LESFWVLFVDDWNPPMPSTSSPRFLTTFAKRWRKAALVIDRLAKAFGIDATQAHDMLHAIDEVITESITGGELRLLRTHLPSELREIFPERPVTLAQSAVS
jgi:uncharacterized protein (DUF2267 family)